MRTMLNAWRRQRWWFRSAVYLQVFGIVVATAVATQTEPAEVKAKVADLVRQLNSIGADTAEKEILRLGPAVIDHLPEPTSTQLSVQQQRRLQTLMPQLWQARLEQDVAGKPVQMPAQTLLLRDALKSIEQQSGNTITDLREEFNQPVTNPQVVFGGGSKSFWEALDQVAQQAEVTYYYHTEHHSVGLVGERPAAQPVAYTGAFRFAIDRLALQVDYTAGDASPIFMVTLSGLVEPRLRPLLIEFDLADFTARDDLRRELAFTGPDKGRFTIEKGSYQFPLILRVAAPPRDATLITEFAGELSVWIPARTAQFEFARLDQGKPMNQLQAGMTVNIGKVTDDDGVWAVPVTVARASVQEDLDSHLQVALENEIYLVASDGSRFDQNGGLSTVFSSPEKTSTEYLFVDAPQKLSEYKLVVRVPGYVTRVPIRFRFQNLLLP